MGRENRMWRAATRAAAVPAVAFLLAAPSCEGPSESGPAPPAWAAMAVVPAGYYVQGIASDYHEGVLAAGGCHDESYVGHGVVLRYRSGAFDVEFISPNDAGNVILYDMDPGGGYAAGTYETYEPRTTRKPYMVALDRSRFEWYEVPLETVEGESITQVVRTGRACWLLIGTTGPRGGELYKYKGEGVVEKQDGLPYFASVAASSQEDTIFGASHVSHGRYNAAMSFDGGTTWRKEEIAVNAPGYEIMFVDAGCAAGRALYFYVRFEGGGVGIVRRSGSPTSGKYELVYFIPRGNFMAAAADVDGRIAAVGLKTSVIFDGGRWRVEELPYPLDLYRVIPAPHGGFLGLGNNEAVWQREVLYHR